MSSGPGSALETAGGVAGGIAGGFAGAAAGSVLGPVGTVAGRWAGARLGQWGGRAAGGYLASKMNEANDKAEPKGEAQDKSQDKPKDPCVGDCDENEDPKKKKVLEEERKKLKERLDAHKEHFTDRYLDTARREQNGEVVATKPDGTPWDHVDEVQNSQRGLRDIIDQTNRRLSNPNTLPSERGPLSDILGEASRMLDRSEQFVPRFGNGGV